MKGLNNYAYLLHLVNSPFQEEILCNTDTGIYPKDEGDWVDSPGHLKHKYQAELSIMIILMTTIIRTNFSSNIFLIQTMIITVIMMLLAMNG